VSGLIEKVVFDAEALAVLQEKGPGNGRAVAERFRDRCVEPVFSEGSPEKDFSPRAAVDRQKAAAGLEAARERRAHGLQFLSVAGIVEKIGREDQIERLVEAQILSVADGVIDPQRLGGFL